MTTWSIRRILLANYTFNTVVINKYKIVLVGGCQYVNDFHHQPLIWRRLRGQYFITHCKNSKEYNLLHFAIIAES